MNNSPPFSAKHATQSIYILFALLLGLTFQACQQAKSPTLDAVYSKIEIPAGICVLLGDDMLDLATHYAQTSDAMIYWQCPSDREINRARTKLDTAGLLGKRVYVEKGSSSKIHLASNLADRVITHPDPAFTQTEIMRVLRPAGQWITKSATKIKPEPAGIDQWTHPYHGPDNNPLSKDKLAKAPYLTHFLAKPYYCPMPEVTVTAGGRIFKAFGHIAFKKREWAKLNKLTAFNGFNGAQLWERDLTPGFMIHRNTMIATPNTLYFADNESCKLIDTKTGELRDEIFIPLNEKDVYGWKWMAMADGTLYALLGEPDIIDEVMRGTKITAGWPWNGLGENYAKLKDQYPWGFGN
ncbi:hypothetical protein GF373_12565, partial [bacterium]|nr:hypothetical protein [bacterium]